ncbi:MAG: hypothetical protein WC496_07170 [Phycisphaerae bacterium]|jgi:hypothetical protein
MADLVQIRINICSLSILSIYNNFKKNIFFSFLIAISDGMLILAYSFLKKVLQGIPLHFLLRDVRYNRFSTDNSVNVQLRKTAEWFFICFGWKLFRLKTYKQGFVEFAGV